MPPKPARVAEARPTFGETLRRTEIVVRSETGLHLATTNLLIGGTVRPEGLTAFSRMSPIAALEPSRWAPSFRVPGPFSFQFVAADGTVIKNSPSPTTKMTIRLAGNEDRKTNAPSPSIPQFKDPRVSAFYRASQVGPIDYNALSLILSEIFRFDIKAAADATLLLREHEHLSPDFALDIADAAQRFLDGLPPRVDRSADIILRYDEIMRQGAEEETRSRLIRWLQDGGVVGEIRPYAVEGAIRVARAMSRESIGHAEDKLKDHKLRDRMQRITEDSLIDSTTSLLDLVEEDAISLGARMDLLAELGLRYDSETAELYREEKKYHLEAGSRELTDILSRLVRLTGDRRIGTQEAKDALGEVVVTMLIRHATQLQGGHLYDTLQGFEADPSPERYYDLAREVIIHGLLDYRFDGIFQTLKAEVLGAFTGRSDLTAQIQTWGEAIPEGEITQAWIDTKVTEYSARADAMRVAGHKGAAGQLYARRKILSNVDLATIKRIEAIETWGDFVRRMPEIMRETRDQQARSQITTRFSYFIEQYRTTVEALASFGKYFTETDLGGPPIELLFVPVKGLAAGVAIDSGSDCGKGSATARSVVDPYTTYLITDSSRTKLWGYMGVFDATSGGGALLQVDALNPSTQLNIKGDQMVRGAQGVLATAVSQSATTPNPIQAVTMASNRDSFSNRFSLAEAHSAFAGPVTRKRYRDIKTGMPSSRSQIPNHIRRMTTASATAGETELERSFRIAIEEEIELITRLQAHYDSSIAELQYLLSQIASDLTDGRGSDSTYISYDLETISTPFSPKGLLSMHVSGLRRFIEGKPDYHDMFSLADQITDIFHQRLFDHYVFIDAQGDIDPYTIFISLNLFGISARPTVRQKIKRVIRILEEQDIIEGANAWQDSTQEGEERALRIEICDRTIILKDLAEQLLEQRSYVVDGFGQTNPESSIIFYEPTETQKTD